MRIALCTDCYRPQLSGVADSVASLAAVLNDRGHQVRIYAPGAVNAKDDAAVVRLPGWEVPGSGGGLVLVYPAGTLADLRAFAPDVIHTHSFSTVGLAALHASRRLRIPLVGTDHTLPVHFLHYAHLDIAPARYAVRRFAAWYHNRCAVVTAPSRMMLDELATFGCDRPGEVISNPIDIEAFRPLLPRHHLKRKLGIGRLAILMLGRVAAEKNWGLARDVFQDIAARSDAELVIVGDGPHREQLGRLLAGRGLAGRCRFLGVRRGTDLIEAINACDAYLITSQSETQSMAMLQAAACGLPVVAVRAGGLPEYVKHGVTGYLVEPDDRAACVASLLHLLENPALAERFGRAGRDYVSQFSPQAVTGRFEAVYAMARMENHFAEPADRRLT